VGCSEKNRATLNSGKTTWVVGAFAAVFVALALAMLGVYEEIGESIRPRSLKGAPARRNPVLEAAWNHACLSYVNFAPPTHPTAGVIGASLVVKASWSLSSATTGS